MIERTTRYQGIFDTERVARTVGVVVGTGAVGRNTALQLASMGIGALVLVDPDVVSGENLGPQGWSPEEVDENKVEALAETIEYINPDVILRTIPAEFSEEDVDTELYDLMDPDEEPVLDEAVVFCCVDNMDVRMQVAKWCLDHEHARLFIEARMGPEICRVYTFKGSGEFKVWEKEWFPHSEAEPESCTERATTYCAAITAALQVNSWTRTLRDLPVPPLVEINLLGLYMLAEHNTQTGEEVIPTGNAE